MKSAALKRAIEEIGGGTRLAEALGVTKQAISGWRHAPALHVATIARLSGVPAHELRPDIFPPPYSTIRDDAA